MGFIINPYAFGVAFTGLLDTYSGAAAAYSVRKLRSAYSGNCIRVRRSNDNTEQDIGFDSNGNLDESALTTFVGSNNGFITTWYDQSGNARNITQSTASGQPQIVYSGTIQKVNSIPCLDFEASGGNYGFLYGTLGSTFSQPIFHTVVSQFPNDNFGFIFDSTGTNRQHLLRDSLSSNMIISAGTGLYTTSNDFSVGTRYLFNVLFDNSSSYIYANNISKVSGNAGSNSFGGDLYVGRNSASAGNFLKAKMQEYIIWNSDQSSNRSGINSNINTYYSIY